MNALQQVHDYWFACAWRIALAMRLETSFKEVASDIMQDVTAFQEAVLLPTTQSRLSGKKGKRPNAYVDPDDTPFERPWKGSKGKNKNKGKGKDKQANWKKRQWKDQSNDQWWKRQSWQLQWHASNLWDATTRTAAAAAVAAAPQAAQAGGGSARDSAEPPRRQRPPQPSPQKASPLTQDAVRSRPHRLAPF